MRATRQRASWILIAAMTMGLSTVWARADEMCHRAIFDEDRPTWTFSGAWAPDGESFYVVDILDNEIDHFDSSGKRLGVLDARAFGLDSFRPSYIDSDGSELVLEIEEGRLLWFDPRTPSSFREIAIAGMTDGNSAATIATVNSWKIARDLVVGFGDVQKGDGTWTSGFFSVPRKSEPRRFDLIEEFPIGSPGRDRNYLGHSYISALPEGGAMILLDEPLTLRVVDSRRAAEKAKVRVEPTDFQDRGPWKSWTVETPHSQKFNDVAASSLVTDLFSDNHFHYLIRRDGLEWTLEKITRNTMETSGVFFLPISPRAHHLVTLYDPTASGGVGRWLFIEKGPVTAPGQQEVMSFVMIEGSAFQGPATSPLGSRGEARRSCGIQK